MKRWVASIGECLVFGGQAIRAMGYGVSPRAVLDQMYTVGVRSLSTTVATGLFVGAIMAIQINLQLRDFGAQSFLGGLTTSVTLRNVGPVLIAFILSGKVGAYTSAELGTMQVTDQINAIRCLGADPLRYLIAPRLVAVVLSSFLLLVVGLMVSLAGALALSHFQLGVNYLNFLANVPQIVTWPSVAMGVVKSFVFGSLIGLIACYRGYTATGGAEGVGEAVKATAVSTLIAIIIANYSISWLWMRVHAWMGG
jgi:phospholipid/cholesterol/gamma-HCH transport system permease protein